MESAGQNRGASTFERVSDDSNTLQRPAPALLPTHLAQDGSVRSVQRQTNRPGVEREFPFGQQVTLGSSPEEISQSTLDSATPIPRRSSSRRTESEQSVNTFSSDPTLRERPAPALIYNRPRAQDMDTAPFPDFHTSLTEFGGSSHKKGDSTIYSITPSSNFDGEIADKETLQDLLEQHPLPAVEGSQSWNQVRYSFFSVYRRLHAIVLIANLVAICVRISQVVRTPGAFTYADAATAVAINLFISTACRHEHCINTFFRICCAMPHWASLSVRRHAAKVYSQGGVHSACGISAFLWYILLSVLLPVQWQGNQGIGTAVFVLSGVMLADFLVLIVMAMPKLRVRFHDQWEMSHRFGGWFAVLIVWTQIALLVLEQSFAQHRSYGYCLVTQPAFWFLAAITLMIIYPWIRLRRRKVEAEKLSDHAVRLNFPNHKRRMTTCAGTRLATYPLTECHGFATIPEANGEKGYSVIVSKAGDWTSSIIDNPPSHLWSRGAPTLGVARVALLFKSIVFVATGSGIGPALSFLQVHPDWPCRVLWSARSPEATYGGRIMGSVLAADSHAVIIDTKKTGKPDLVGLTYALVKEIEAEAVVIISNPKATQEVVFGMETRKIPAYGAIFDS